MKREEKCEWISGCLSTGCGNRDNQVKLQDDDQEELVLS